MNNIIQTLKDHWGYENFRSRQEDVIKNILLKRNTVGILPTGAGKSLCYMLPSLHLPGVVIVVTPLISLINDQIRAAVEVGIKAGSVNSTMTHDEKNEFFCKFSAAAYDIVFVSPEMLTGGKFRYVLKSCQIALWVVDEAHCMHIWGAEFRPSYLDAAKLIRKNALLRRIPIAAFTATATEDTTVAIISLLGMDDCDVFKTSFYRENLEITINEKMNDVKEQILGYVSGVEKYVSPSIIYRTTRADVDSTARYLSSEGIRASPYHAGLTSETRALNQEQFMSGEVNVIVATIAFGMGIDKPDVRYVLHADLPKNLEGYYQEIGRAGRDGLRSYCELLYDPGDITPMWKMAVRTVEDEDQREKIKNDLIKIADYAQSDTCRWQQILEHFGEGSEPCGKCDNCREETE